MVALLQEIDERYLGDEWSAPAFGDLPDGYRSVASLLEGALSLNFEADPERSFFRPIGSRTRKMLGDNPDAVYYAAPIRDDRAYRVTGNRAGCVYLSFTVELGSQNGGYSTATAACSATPTSTSARTAASRSTSVDEARPRNWLALPDDASEIIVRCYFEDAATSGRGSEPDRPVDDGSRRTDRAAHAVG